MAFFMDLRYWPDLRYIFTLVIFCISLPSFSINCLGVTKMNLKVIFLECTEPSLAWSLFKFVFLHNSIWTRWNCDPSNVFFFHFFPGFSTSSSSSSLRPDSKAWKNIVCNSNKHFLNFNVYLASKQIQITNILQGRIDWPHHSVR